MNDKFIRDWIKNLFTYHELIIEYEKTVFKMKPGITKNTKVKEIEDRLRLHTRVGVDGGLVLEIADPVEKLLHIVGAGFFNEPRYYDSDETNDQGLTKNALELLEIIEQAILYLNETEKYENFYYDDLFILARYIREGLKIRTTPAVILAFKKPILLPNGNTNN